jgi:hypothetical protein
MSHALFYRFAGEWIQSDPRKGELSKRAGEDKLRPYEQVRGKSGRSL